MNKCLAELADIFQGKDYKANPPGEAIPIWGTGGIIGGTSLELNHGPAILTGRKGSIGNTFYVEGPFWNVDTIYCIKPRIGIHAKWLYYNLRSKDLTRLNEATGVPSVNTKALNSLNFNYVTHPDQRRIAVILDTVDEAIRQTEAMVEKLKNIKQGLLHDLLTRGIGKDGKLRPPPDQVPHLYKDSPLGKIPKEWEVVKISSCSETFAGGTPARGRLDYYGGSIPWIKSAEVNLDEILSTEETLTEKGQRFSSARWIEPNITLIAMYGATAGQVSWLKIRATANQAVLALPVRDSQTDQRWLYWAAKIAMPRIMASVQGSGQPNLSKGVIDKSLISRPLLGEQKAVRDYLDQVLDNIRAEVFVANKFRLLKQGLMEDLLTGRVSVTGLPKNIEKMLDEAAERN